MIKTAIKLVIAALVANACWRVASAYSTFLRFKDAVEETTQFSSGRSDNELHARIVELAGEYDVPLAPDALTIHHLESHTMVEGEYTEQIVLAPGYTRPWTFTLKTDTFVRVPTKLDPSAVK